MATPPLVLFLMMQIGMLFKHSLSVDMLMLHVNLPIFKMQICQDSVNTMKSSLLQKYACYICVPTVSYFLFMLQVGDLGLSKVKRQTMVSGGVRGTLPWMAPELLNGCSSFVTEKVGHTSL